MRFLPHFKEDGETTRAFHWTHCYMAYPECEQDAIRAATVLDDESRAIKLGLQSDFGAIGKMVRKKTPITTNCRKNFRFDFLSNDSQLRKER